MIDRDILGWNEALVCTVPRRNLDPAVALVRVDDDDGLALCETANLSAICTFINRHPLTFDRHLLLVRGSKVPQHDRSQEPAQSACPGARRSRHSRLEYRLLLLDARGAFVPRRRASRARLLLVVRPARRRHRRRVAALRLDDGVHVVIRMSECMRCREVDGGVSRLARACRLI